MRKVNSSVILANKHLEKLQLFKFARNKMAYFKGFIIKSPIVTVFL